MGHNRCTHAPPRMSTKQGPNPPVVRIVWQGPLDASNQGSGRSIDFFVFADPEMVQKWRKDKSIPLVDVVDNFEIYEVTNGGNTGIYTRPSLQSLHTTFTTTDTDTILTRILSEGKIMQSGAPRTSSKNEYDTIGVPRNMTRGRVMRGEGVVGVHQ